MTARARMEDLGRRGSPDPDRPRDQSQPQPAHVRRRRAYLDRTRRQPTTSLPDVPDVSGPVVLVVGSEGDGLSRLVREACDYAAAIPISKSIESSERRGGRRHRPL